MSKSIKVSKPKTKPKTDFWSLAGSLGSNIKLSDKQLRKARDSFSKNWAQI